jgi:Protein of unknown function (DUF2934)
MQSDKTSSRKPKAAAESVPPTPEAAASAPVTKTRKATPSAAKKASPKETSSVKRHRKSATAPASEPAVSSTPLPAPSSAEPGDAATSPKAMAAASGTSYSSYRSDVVESVGNIIEPIQTTTQTTGAGEGNTLSELDRDEIERLAYSYWVARGQQHGSHIDDWVRAEQELRARR